MADDMVSDVATLDGCGSTGLPSRWVPSFQRAVESFNVKRDHEVVRLLEPLHAALPQEPQVTRFLGASYQRLGHHDKAAQCFQQVLEVWPQDYLLRLGFAICLNEIGRPEEAIAEFKEACRLNPASVDAWYDLGEIMAREQHSSEAADALRTAIELDPKHVLARLSLARVYVNLGKIDDAVKQFRSVLELEPDNVTAWFGLSYLGKGYLGRSDYDKLKLALCSRQISPMGREQLLYAMAKAYENEQEYEQAFEYFRQANRLGRDRVKWDPVASSDRISAVIREFDRLPATKRESTFGNEVIFVVSMPRSGSTLVEQILASHPKVQGAGEIRTLSDVLRDETHRRKVLFPTWVSAATDSDWRRLGEQYLSRTERWRTEKPKFTDKYLLNWPLVGAIVNMLPGAHVVVVRRDPVETCLGCYRQCFGSMFGFASDLEHTAAHYADFVRLTDFWCQRFPSNVTLVRYEQLVQQPRDVVSQLLQSCGLTFEPACLEFGGADRPVLSLPSAAEVRGPLRRDTAKASRYGAMLDQLRGYLDAYGVLGA